MTDEQLRQELAIAAMQAILMRQERGARKSYRSMAHAAWAMADVMIEAKFDLDRDNVRELPDNTMGDSHEQP